MPPSSEFINFVKCNILITGHLGVIAIIELGGVVSIYVIGNTESFDNFSDRLGVSSEDRWTCNRSLWHTIIKWMDM